METETWLREEITRLWAEQENTEQPYWVSLPARDIDGRPPVPGNI